MTHICRCCNRVHGNTEAETRECYRLMPIELREACWSGMEIDRLVDNYNKEQQLKKWRPSEQR